MTSDQATAAGPAVPSLPQTDHARLDDLLKELLARIGDVVTTRDRLQSLLDAVVSVTSDLDLPAVLDRIVAAACRLANAEFGALGVIDGQGRRLDQFVTYGLTPERRAEIGDPPHGRGILGVLIEDPRPIRLDDIGRDPRSHGFPPDHPPMSSFLGVPVRTRGRVFGNLYLTEKRGSGAFTQDDEDIVVALAAAAGVAIENARLYEQSEQRRRWLEAAGEITALLLGSVDRREALMLVASRARRLMAAELAAILIPDPAGSLLVEAVASSGHERPDGDEPSPGAGTQLLEADVSLPVEMAKVVARTGEPMLLDHGSAGRSQPPDGPAGLGSVLLAPLPGASGTGVILVGWAAGLEPRLDDDAVPLLKSFADQAGMALQRAQAQDDRSQLAVYEDRERIARDLHDLVIQRLFATCLSLQSLRRHVSEPAAEQRLDAAVADLDQTIREIRSTIFRLSEHRSGTDFRSEVFRLIAEMEVALGLAPRLTTSGPVGTAVSPQIRPAVLAALREALSNVARHASASTVEVEVSVGQTVTLTVRDDGVGMGTSTRRSGLANLRERAQRLGGTLEVEGCAGGGTVLVWSVPA